MPGVIVMDHAPRFSDCTNRPGSPEARGVIDACEVELDSDGEVDARDDLHSSNYELHYEGVAHRLS
eukprot:1382189-Prymnesium_polylepis.1